MNTYMNNNVAPQTAEYNPTNGVDNGAGKKITAYFNKRHFEYVVSNDIQVQKQSGYIATFYPGTMTIKIELEY